MTPKLCLVLGVTTDYLTAYSSWKSNQNKTTMCVLECKFDVKEKVDFQYISINNLTTRLAQKCRKT